MKKISYLCSGKEALTGLKSSSTACGHKKTCHLKRRHVPQTNILQTNYNHEDYFFSFAIVLAEDIFSKPLANAS
jgi:hypothetical protein